MIVKSDNELGRDVGTDDPVEFTAGLAPRVVVLNWTTGLSTTKSPIWREASRPIVAREAPPIPKPVMFSSVRGLCWISRFFSVNGVLMDVPHRQVVFTIPKTLRIFLKFRRRLLGKLCRSAVKTLTVYFEALTGETLVPGTSVRARIALHMLLAPELVRGVEFLCKPVGTVEARVPRGYLIPAELDLIAEKLRAQNVKVEVLAKPVKVTGEEFVIDKVGQGRSGGYNMIKLDGGFAPSPVREFPAGTFRVDMAQSLANLAFYCLEPQAADGFVGWGVFDAYFKSVGTDKRSVVYPVYKYFKILE